MKTEKLVMICLMCIASFAIQAQKVIKIGIIGLDTSHSPAFIGLLNSEDPKPEHEGCSLSLWIENYRKQF
jgi:hypothetical protein